MEEPAAQFPPNHLLAPNALRVTWFGGIIIEVWQHFYYSPPQISQERISR
ncbi:MAG: hypothetical protein HYW48_01120 [Deltaproteobacteria bacterium]|nr:hypothetical protein [Deltaproteobacteria bacterium]